MQRLHAFPVSFAKTLLFIWVLSVSIVVSAANSYQQVELRYRSASSLQQSLSPLASRDLTIVAEGNSLILKGPTAEIRQLVAIIKKLDQPRKQLLVSIYRGIDPGSLEAISAGGTHQDQRWSTQSGKRNRVDTVRIEEGAAVIINETDVLSIPVDQYEAVATRQSQSTLDKGANIDKSANQDYRADYQRQKTIVIEKGLRLVPTLTQNSKGEPRVSLATTYFLPSEPNDGDSTSQQESRSLSTSSTTVALVELNQWQFLSSHQQQSHRPNISTAKAASTRVVSTSKKGGYEYKVWVKFTIQ